MAAHNARACYLKYIAFSRHMRRGRRVKRGHVASSVKRGHVASSVNGAGEGLDWGSLGPVLKWARKQFMHIQACGCILTVVACCMLLSDYGGGLAPSAGFVRAGGANLSGGADETSLGGGAPAPARLVMRASTFATYCILFACSLATWSFAFLNDLFTPSARLGVLWHTIRAMIFDDIIPYLVMLVT